MDSQHSDVPHMCDLSKFSSIHIVFCLFEKHQYTELAYIIMEDTDSRQYLFRAKVRSTGPFPVAKTMYGVKDYKFVEA